MNFIDVLVSKPHNPHYLNRYIKIIAHFIKNTTDVGEIHHICPKSDDLFPEFKSLSKNTWNKVTLPHRVHFMVHWLLHKAYKGKQTYAYIAMCNQLSPTKIKIQRKRPNSRWYKSARLEANILISKANSRPNPKTSIAMKGKVSCKDVDGNVLRVSQEEFDLNENLVGLRHGQKDVDSHMKTTEHKERTSKIMSDRIHIVHKDTNKRKFVKPSELNDYLNNGYIYYVFPPRKKEAVLVCDHCKIKFDKGNYTKWHGDNCKLSPTNINPLFA